MATYLTSSVKSEKKHRSLLEYLQKARSKLTPIVDDIITSSFDRIQNGDHKFVNDYILTPKRFHDVLNAWQIFQEVQNGYNKKSRRCVLPNTEIIINNVSVDEKSRTTSVRDKSIVIDEATVVELLELYENMGVVLQRMMSEGTRESEEPLPKSIERILSGPLPKSIERILSGTRSSSKTRSPSSERVPTPAGSRKTSLEEDQEDLIPPTIKSTMSALLDSSSGDLNKEQSGSEKSKSKNHVHEGIATEDEAAKNDDDEPTIFIRIQCFSDWSDTEYDSTTQIKCAKNCASHYHVKLGGDPVTLKVNQGADDGTVYCINTGKDNEDREIKIVIKQCPECMSTIVGSSTRIEDMLGESHESITLHGKQGDESVMSYSSDDDSLQESEQVRSISEQRLISDQKVTSDRKLDVLIDADNVDKSSIKVLHGSTAEDAGGIADRESSERGSVKSKRESISTPDRESSERGSPDRESSERGSVKSKRESISTPDRESSERGSPDRESSERGSPDRESSERGSVKSKRESISTPDRESSERGSPDRESSERGSPDRESSERGSVKSKRESIPTPDRESSERGSPDRESSERSSVKSKPDREPSVMGSIKSKRDSIPTSPKQPSPQTSTDKIEPKGDPRRPDREILLTRKRICSSMEFDVSTQHSRLRGQEIEHGNARVVLELKKLGVDQLLRACRPARCCRKAILNEKQRTALPYCVSLKSLPLVPDDVEVIKQSIDMSVRKIKNTTDLTQVQKDKMAFYVSLGRDDVQPNINFPWVVPVYDVRVSPNKMNDDRFFLLKKYVTIPKQLGSVARLTRVLKCEMQENECLEKHLKNIPRRRYFILTRPRSLKVANEGDSKIEMINSIFRKQIRKTKQKRVRFEKQERNLKGNDQNYYTNIFKRNRRSICKMKNVCNNVEDADWRFTFAQKYEQLGSDYLFDHTRICKDYYESNLTAFNHCQKLSKLTKLTRQSGNFAKTSVKKSLDGGDYSFSSLNNMLDFCFKESSSETKKSSTSELNKSRSLISTRSMPTFMKEVSEELFYTSKSLTFFIKRTHSLQKLENKTKVVEDPLKLFSFKYLDQKRRRIPKTKLQYYIALINGDLVWSNTFPLKPLKYNLYYNYSNENLQFPQINAAEESIVPRRVSLEEASRMRSLILFRSESAIPDSRTAITEIDGPKLPEEFRSYSMESESPGEPWAPFVVSDSSLPRIREEITKSKMEKTETTPKAERTPEKEEIVTAPEKNEKCSSKPVCVKNRCADHDKCDTEKCRSREIRIAIKATKDKGLVVEGTGPKPCTKEICEIYKNKNLMSEKGGDNAKIKEDCGQQEFRITGKDNIEIYVNNKKICVSNVKGRKSSKEGKEKKKDVKEK